MTKLSDKNANSVIGLIPAAGRATRLGRLPFSKELLPIPGGSCSSGESAIRLAIENSVEFLLECGIQRQHVVIAPAKQDISQHLGDGTHYGAAISYTLITDSPSVPHSLDAAYESFDGAQVVLVFPDIMFEPRAAIAKVIADWTADDADVLLAMVPSTRSDKVDIVLTGDDGIVTKILPKPGAGHNGWTWVVAAWTPRFSAYLHQRVCGARNCPQPGDDQEPYVGNILNAAISDGLVVRAEKFAQSSMVDIGTPDDFAAAWLGPA